ncbi:MAG: putative glycosyltransferase [Actinomycetia bacterium]|nr:putative glycosyltransferase [Actinomycetes bacterium]
MTLPAGQPSESFPSESQAGVQRPRVLVCTTWFPIPADNGIKQRLWALLGGLHERFDVDLVALLDEPVAAADVAAARARCDRVEVVIRRPFEPRSARAMLSFFHPMPRALVASRTAAMQHTVERLVNERGYAAAIAAEVHVAQYLRSLRGLPRVLEDVELTGLRETNAGANRRLRVRLRDELTWWKVQRYVRSLLAEFDLCTTVSERERDAARQLRPSARCVVVPNGVDTQGAVRGVTPPTAATMIYAGSPTFALNREAVEWFASNVLPRVAARVDDCRLRVTGRYEPLVGELPVDDHIEYTGHLPDVHQAVAGSWLSVVPLQRGGGTRLKVLESLALGTPVVSTSKGVEGLDLVAGEEVLVADTAEAFAAAVLEVFADPARRDALAVAGRRAVEERYDWLPIARRFTDVVVEVATPRPR